MICYSHTNHNAITAAIKSSSIKKFIDKVHQNNSWFKRTVERQTALKNVFDT